MQGRVVDTDQGAIPGVTVTLTNVDTGVTVDRLSYGEGRYLFDFVGGLAPGCRGAMIAGCKRSWIGARS